ncbi:Phosphocarrier protein HPr /phosphoenolpyruvate--protein phosphotransferase /PTS system IIA component, Glc family [Sphingomonas gellani]|uniref:phosphoenolpyruvate--protein phosphotransferase n=1 Tax=Sphingomonas gellani TaxID=1166340 RepID=A0A1H8D0I8_9SPHN|nr:phosphoenolpyruvate--protein phosphotransferase [Sphingomonas gellani]SEN00128.1 Phosphocarrier protein HPr /phosphoenolpyruvate--protein phosphotransferase /PTS system IIA component, Glc family [Sphingomonas gellani]
MATITLAAPLDGWITPLSDVPDPVFAERMLGDGIAVDPVGDLLCAPCAGTVLSVQSTGHALTMTAEGGAQLLIHLGLDTVALGGRGFTVLVRGGDTVAAGTPLIRFDLDLLVREARAMVTPILLVGDGWQVRDRAAPGPIASGAPLMTLARVDPAAPPPSGTDGALFERTLVVALPHGIHARPAARIATLARQQPAAVTIARNGEHADAVSPTGLMALTIGRGDTVTLSARGAGAEQSVGALIALIESGMNEAEAAAAQPPVVQAPSAADRPAGALTGVTAVPGLAVGIAHRLRTADLDVPEHGVGIAQEEAAFEAARQALSGDLTLRERAATGPARAIMEAHRALLDDPALLDAVRAGIVRGESAGHALRGAIRPLAGRLRAGGDARLAERADDMLDLERQLIARLFGNTTVPSSYPPGTILLADDLLPSDLMAIDAKALAGLVVERGGPTSHVAVLAASLGLPTLVAVGAALGGVDEGSRVVLDAGAGWVLADPDADLLDTARGRVADEARRGADMLARAGERCVTADGTRIEVFANLGSADDAAPAVARGAEGCGLLRTEFLFLDRDTMPTVAEQAAEYQRIAEGLEGRPLIVRLLDIGGDKPASYLPILAEENPALGLRGIRVSLAYPAVLEDQIRAILSVRPIGQCRIMLPMVAGLDEVRAVRAVLDRLRAELSITDPVALGIMVETPAAAVTADLFAAEVDFLSIGTNDLTQYVLAMDRGNPAVAGGVDGLHPAVLRLIGTTCDGGARQGRWTGVCGGLASDPLAVPILIGLGVTELSAAPAVVPEIKALVSTLSMAACRDHATAALRCDSAAGVRTLARRFAKEGAKA